MTRYGELPVIDIAPFLAESSNPGADLVAEQIRAACETVGFFVIAGHDIDAGDIVRMCEVTRQFFERPEADKLALDTPAGGYRPGGTGSLARTAGGRTPPDLCETFRYQPTPCSHDPAPFPAEPAEMSAVWRHWFADMERLAARLLAAMARSLGLTDEWFEPFFARHSSSLIANYYPTLRHDPLEGQLRRGAHTDFGALTILHQTDDHGGLEVRDPVTHAWRAVPLVPGTFIVNIGDLMERWTNGRWVSTLHRVANPAPEGDAPSHPARISLPFFHRPDPASTIEVIGTCVPEGHTANFPPVIAGEWMAAKQQLIYG